MCLQILDFFALFTQIDHVSEDAHSELEPLKPKFFVISYTCLLPFAYSFYSIYQFFKLDCRKTVEMLVKGAMASAMSVAMLFLWFLTYFSSIATNSDMEARIVLVLMLIGLPQASLHLFCY